jgi:hypothetical protein
MMTVSVLTFRHFVARIFIVGTAVVCLSTTLSLAGCGKKTPPPPAEPAAPPPPPPPPAPAPAPAAAAVASVSLGKSVGPDKKVSAPVETFGPKDTLYASVETTGTGKATTVKAKWTFTGKKGNVVPVHEEAQTVDLDGPATHEFHVSKKTPWPKGAYDVEIFLNDVSAAKKTFSVN